MKKPSICIPHPAEFWFVVIFLGCGACAFLILALICALRGEPIEKAKRKKPGNTSEKERPQKKRFRRRRRKKGTSPGTPQENS